MSLKISACTLIKNAKLYEYPIIESITSLLPYVDEYIVNCGSQEDLDLVLSHFLSDSKVKPFLSEWEGKDQGMAFFRNQTNKSIALAQGDWIVYCQSDEIIHEKDGERLKDIIKYADDRSCDAIAVNFIHFCKDYFHIFKTYSEGFDMYEKQVRIIKNNGLIKSVGDACGFIGFNNVFFSDLVWYHVGYVKDAKTMLIKKQDLKEFYFADPAFDENLRIIENGKIRSDSEGNYKFTRQTNPYNGPWPAVLGVK